MKVTIDFFDIGKNVINKILNGVTYLKYVAFLSVLTITITVVMGLLINNTYINSNILCLSSNIRQAEKLDVSKKQLMIMANNINSPFLEKTEYTNKNKVENVDKATKKNENEFDTSAVDSVETFSFKTDPNLSITNTDLVQKINVYGMTISNYSSKRNIDILSLFKKNIILTKKSDPILIYSTHTSESYTNSSRYKFDYSSTYRTRDAKYNMLSVGNILSQALREKNMNVVFDTTPHDYGSYEIAYTNSRKTLETALKNNERIGLAIDVHRDALGDLTKGLTVDINGKKVAQLMFVMGVGTKSYENEYWEDNLALALQLQKLGEEMYPGLFRGMLIRNSKYNQDLVKHSFLIEVGTTGNTLEEAYFASRCLANILNKFYNN